MIRYLKRAMQLCLGWNIIRNVPKENCVAVYAHTSYWEAFLLLLYGSETRIITLLKPQLFHWFTSPILNYLGYFPAPKLENRGTGSVKVIADMLKSMISTNQNIILLISPKGTIHNRPWRTGYKYIAKELGWPIKLMLVDYVKRTIHFQDTNENDTQEALQMSLSKACPRNPCNSEFELQCDMDPFELLSVIDVLVISNWAMLLPIYKAFLLQDYVIALWALMVFFASSYYHCCREECGSFADKILTKSLLVYSFLYYITNLNLYVVCMTLISLWAYYAGTPRIPGNLRGPYVVYHTIFHLLISATAYLLIH